MEDPADRRQRLHRKNKKRVSREMAKQQRAFRKGEKPRIPKSIRPDVERLDEILDQIAQLQRRKNEISGAKTEIATREYILENEIKYRQKQLDAIRERKPITEAGWAAELAQIEDVMQSLKKESSRHLKELLDDPLEQSENKSQENPGQIKHAELD